MAKKEQLPNALAVVAAPPHTVEITVERTDTKAEKIEAELKHGSLADSRLIVAFVGANQTGAVSPNEVVLDVPAGSIAAVSFASKGKNS